MSLTVTKIYKADIGMCTGHGISVDFYHDETHRHYMRRTLPNGETIDYGSHRLFFKALSEHSKLMMVADKALLKNGMPTDIVNIINMFSIFN
jgi:hypothetical protein